MPTPDTTTTEATSSTSSSAGTLLTATESRTIKPGWRTSEFWLSFAAALVGAFLASGLVADGSQVMRIAGMAAIALSTLGYTVARGAAKRGGAALVLLFALMVAPTSSGCGTLGDKAKAGGRAFVDCMTPAAKSAAGELAPAFGAILRNALASDGKIDRSMLGEVAAPLKTDGPRCALDAAIAALLTPAAPKAGAPQSSPLEVDEADLSSAYADVRANLWGGAELHR